MVSKQRKHNFTFQASSVAVFRYTTDVYHFIKLKKFEVSKQGFLFMVVTNTLTCRDFEFVNQKQTLGKLLQKRKTLISDEIMVKTQN